MSRLTVCPCGKEFELAGTRGRPHTRCPDCRGNESVRKMQDDVRAKLTADQIVDRLEINLKARNLHISQHRDKWE